MCSDFNLISIFFCSVSLCNRYVCSIGLFCKNEEKRLFSYVIEFIENWERNLWNKIKYHIVDFFLDFSQLCTAHFETARPAFLVDSINFHLFAELTNRSFNSCNILEKKTIKFSEKFKNEFIFESKIFQKAKKNIRNLPITFKLVGKSSARGL